MNAIVLSIGDELVLGQTVDTNSAWLSRQLAAIGCEIAAHVTVADDQRRIESALRDAATKCDFLMVSGGLGPTQDDLTRQALAAVLEQPLELHPQWLAHLEDYFLKRGRPMPATNRVQAMIPRGARMIENTCGTAPGIDADLPGAPRSCRVFCMPGVPSEMKIMFQRDVAPHVAAATAGRVILSRVLHTFGLGESVVAQQLGELMDRSRNPSVGTTVSSGVVSLRLNARFDGAERAQEELDRTEQLCRAALGDLIYGRDQQTLPQVVGQMLLDKSATLTTAESCTAGLLAKMITDVPGSSRYFHRGWITYSDDAKTDLLGVDPELIQRHGAVSEPVVMAMATSARRKADATYALAISGIAGPDGGTPAKPVGTVCIALAHPRDAAARTFHLPGDREMVRQRSANMALSVVRFHLLGKTPPF